MSIETQVRPRRRRRSPEEARREAITEARALLLSGGPDAVTLSAVAGRIGVTHANLIHHFGSASGLQSALMGSMVHLASAIQDAVERLRTDEGAPLEVVNAVFEAFTAGGAGRLAAWIALSGDLTHLEPVRIAVQDLVKAIDTKIGNGDRLPPKAIGGAVLFIALTAFGEALIGQPLRDMLDQDEDASRNVVAQLLPSFLAKNSVPS